MVDSLLPSYMEFIQPIRAKMDAMPITPYVAEEADAQE